MDSNPKKQLLDKYWEAETSNEEELALKSSSEQLDSPEKEYFEMLNKLDAEILDASFDKEVMQKITAPKQTSSTWVVYRNNYKLIAATIVLVMVSGLLIFNFQKEKTAPLAMEDDPKKAFEMTKQALMMISSRLNKGTDYTNELVKFEQTKSKINKLEN
jgi:hypothetical protein